MSIGIPHIIGILLTLALIVGVGLYSGSKVKSAADFATGGGKAGSMLVCGGILGALVSSQATIGTAQLAFQYGLAAWWFTLGAGIGCLFLALFYTGPLRRSGCVTELEVISREYGTKVEEVGSVLCSIGIFISVLAQVVACAGLLTVIAQGISTPVAVLVSVVLMTVYVLFGGAWGAGMGGIVKLILLYVASIVGFALVMANSGGFTGLYSQLKTVLVGTDLGTVQSSLSLSQITSEADLRHRFFNLVARGPFKDIGSGLSLLLGVLSTQTYAQAVLSGKTTRSAKKGALLSACLIPPLGIAGIMIGLYMRANYVTQAEVDALASVGQSVPDGMGVIASTIQVFPVFVVKCMPALLGGIVLGTLLISIVGGGAGLSLGVATILVKDIYGKISDKMNDAKVSLMATRLTIVAVMAAAFAIALVVPSATINDFGFLSMGLRGSVAFIPMTCALFFPGKISPKFVMASTILGPIAVLAGNFMTLPFDSLFLGLGVSLVLTILGAIFHHNTPIQNASAEHSSKQ
jgi:SSS family solute:Na+ symporter